MPKEYQILERKEIPEILQRHGITRQYQKARDAFLRGDTLQIKFQERNPKGCGIWYFRINKKYRALGTFDELGRLIVYEIDTHQ